MGILGEVKQQSNVAGWIHAGGLWGDHDPPSEKGTFSFFISHSSLFILNYRTIQTFLRRRGIRNRGKASRLRIPLLQKVYAYQSWE